MVNLNRFYKTELKEIKVILDFIQRHDTFIDNLRLKELKEFDEIREKYQELQKTLFKNINYQELLKEIK